MHLHDDLGVVVPELRAHHRQRRGIRRRCRRDGQPVRSLPVRRITGGVDGIRHGDGDRAVDGIARIERDDRALVENDRTGDVAAGEGAVLEALVDGGRRLGVVGLHEVVPDRATLIGAVTIREVSKELRVARFGATTGTKDRADERRHGDHVVDRGRLTLLAGRGPVGVEPVGVGLGIVDDLLALLAIRVEDQLDLFVDERLDGRARLVGRGAGDQRERVETGDVGDCRASRAATEVDQQSPITTRDPTRSESESLACLGGDVRYPELVVDNLDVVAADVLDSGLADRREVLGEEELVEILRIDVVAERCETVVEGQLVEAVVVDRQPAVVAGGKDVVRPIFGDRRRRLRGRGRRRRLCRCRIGRSRRGRARCCAVVSITRARGCDQCAGEDDDEQASGTVGSKTHGDSP